MEDNKLSIRINVAERFYPLRIAPQDEERLRRAARMINDKLSQYKQRYVERDLQDALAITALQFVIRLIELEEKRDISPVVNELMALDKELENYLNIVKG
ncbi:MAG: cell division protein ZapA [Prevotellaceae bacterium]|jgi:cell division protein ZapA|nr:cell division protein ZapA [Prevotellaceae bacterium]